MGESDPEISKKIQEHLEECESCQEEFEEIHYLWSKLDLLPQETPSNRVRERFYAMLDGYKNSMSAQKSRARFRDVLDGWLGHFWPKRPAFQLTAALLFLVFGIAGGYFLRSNGSHRETISVLQNEVQDMRQTIAVSLLQKPSAVERLRGVNLSYKVDRPHAEMIDTLLKTLDKDPNVNVRLAAVEALYFFHENPKVKKVLVVEINPDVIALIGPHFTSPKLEIIEGDIFNIDIKGKWDTIYFDIWTDICTDNLKEIRKLHNKFKFKLNRKNPNCWMSSWKVHELRDIRRRQREQEKMWPM